MVVTIWVGADARHGDNNEHRVTEAQWAAFVDSINRGQFEGQLEDAQAELLHEWLDEWVAKQA
jgi:hypothetical protein